MLWRILKVVMAFVISTWDKINKKQGEFPQTMCFSNIHLSVELQSGETDQTFAFSPALGRRCCNSYTTCHLVLGLCPALTFTILRFTNFDIFSNYLSTMLIICYYLINHLVDEMLTIKAWRISCLHTDVLRFLTCNDQQQKNIEHIHEWIIILSC